MDAAKTAAKKQPWVSTRSSARRRVAGSEAGDSIAPQKEVSAPTSQSADAARPQPEGPEKGDGAAEQTNGMPTVVPDQCLLLAEERRCDGSTGEANAMSDTPNRRRVGVDAACQSIDRNAPHVELLDASTDPPDEDVMMHDAGTECDDLARSLERRVASTARRGVVGLGASCPQMIHRLGAPSKVQEPEELLCHAMLDGSTMLVGGVSKVFVVQAPQFELKTSFHVQPTPSGVDFGQGGEARCTSLTVTTGDRPSPSCARSMSTGSTANGGGSASAAALVWSIWSDMTLRLLIPQATTVPRRLLRLRLAYQTLMDVRPDDVGAVVALDQRTICVIPTSSLRCIIYQAQGCNSLPHSGREDASALLVVEKVWRGPPTRSSSDDATFVAATSFQASSGSPGIALLVGRRLLVAPFDGTSDGSVASLTPDEGDNSGGSEGQLPWRELDLDLGNGSLPTCLVWHSAAALFCVGASDGSVQLWCVWDGEAASCSHVYPCSSLERTPVVQLSAVGVSKILAVRSSPFSVATWNPHSPQETLLTELLDVRDASLPSESASRPGASTLLPPATSSFPLYPLVDHPLGGCDELRPRPAGETIVMLDTRTTSRLMWIAQPQRPRADRDEWGADGRLDLTLWALPESQESAHFPDRGNDRIDDAEAVIRTAVHAERQRHQALLRELKESDAARCALESRVKGLLEELDQCRRPPKQVSIERVTLQQLAGDFEQSDDTADPRDRRELLAECGQLRRDLATALSLLESTAAAAKKGGTTKVTLAAPRCHLDDNFIWSMMTERQRVEGSEARNRLDLCVLYAELKVSSRQRASQKTLERAVNSASQFHNRQGIQHERVRDESADLMSPSVRSASPNGSSMKQVAAGGRLHPRRQEAARRVAFARGQLADPDD